MCVQIELSVRFDIILQIVLSLSQVYCVHNMNPSPDKRHISMRNIKEGAKQTSANLNLNLLALS